MAISWHPPDIKRDKFALKVFSNKSHQDPCGECLNHRVIIIHYYTDLCKPGIIVESMCIINAHTTFNTLHISKKPQHEHQQHTISSGLAYASVSWCSSSVFSGGARPLGLNRVKYVFNTEVTGELFTTVCFYNRSHVFYGLRWLWFVVNIWLLYGLRFQLA